MDNYDTQTWPKQATINGYGGQSQSTLIGVDANVSQVTNPPGPGTLLTIQKPAYIKVFQNLESTAQIYASASPAAPGNTIPTKVEYRAGKCITLSPGFEVESGADFFAYVKRYVCSENDYGLGMRQAPSTSQASSDYMGDYMNSEVPIHWVESPPSASDLYPFGDELSDNTAGVEKFAAEQEFKIVPNPSTGIFHLMTQKLSEEEVLSADVYDMKGQLIYSVHNIGSEHEINLGLYSNGIYMIQVTSDRGRSMVKKVDISR
jgi:hypothetical protein